MPVVLYLVGFVVKSLQNPIVLLLGLLLCFLVPRLWLGRRTPKTPAQRASALAGIAQCNADWDAGELTTSDDMIRQGRDQHWRAGYELRWNEVATTLARFEPDAGLATFRRLSRRDIGLRQVIAREQIARARRAGNEAKAAELRRMEDALADALKEMAP